MVYTASAIFYLFFFIFFFFQNKGFALAAFLIIAMVRFERGEKKVAYVVKCIHTLCVCAYVIEALDEIPFPDRKISRPPLAQKEKKSHQVDKFKRVGGSNKRVTEKKCNLKVTNEDDI